MTALVDAVTGLRNTRRAIGDGTLAGRHLLATPAYPPPRAKAQTATHDDPAVDGIEPGHVHIPSDLDPTTVVEGLADPGDSGELADALHVHRFELSLVTPTMVDAGGPGAIGVGVVPARSDHAHGLDLDELGIPDWDVDPTPDTLVLRGLGGTVAAAPSTAANHALVDSQATVTATAHAVVRRNASGRAEVADAAGDLDALNRRTGDARFAPAAHVGETGLGVHGATASSTGVGQIMARNANGEVFISAVSPTAVTSVLSRQMGDGLYVEMAGDTMTGTLRVPAGTAATPGLEVGEAGLGLVGDTGADTLALVAGGSERARISGAGLRPATAGLKLGLGGSEWGDVNSNGVIKTNRAADPDPALDVVNGWANVAGQIETGEHVQAPNGTFGLRTRGLAALTGASGFPNTDGVTMGTKGAHLRVMDDFYTSFDRVEAEGYDIGSDARTKAQVRDNTEDDLTQVRATKTSRFRRRKSRPRDDDWGDPREPKLKAPADWEDYLTEEQIGWLANNVTPDVAVLMGGDSEGNFEAGVSLEQMLAKLWHAFQQECDIVDLLTARLDALETR